MANEIVAAERWLYTVLKNDATLNTLVAGRVFSDVVKPGTPYPLVFYTMTAAINRQTLQGYIIWAELVYIVRYVHRVESYVALEAGATAIEAALHRASGTNVSGVVVSCVYDEPFKQPEIDPDGSQIRSLGGQYRLNVQ
jgi:hypothetical protein